MNGNDKGSTNSQTPAACCVPQSKTDLFVSFTFLALQGFGGVLTVVQRELVEKKKWLTLDEFVEDWAVAQILPGPNVVNLALMFGGRHFGIAGAMAALGGLLLAPTVLVLLLAAAVAGVADTEVAQGMLRGMGAVAAGMIAAVGMKLVDALKNNPMGLWTCLAIGTLTFFTIGVFRLPLAWIILSLGPLATVWAAHCLRQRANA